MANQKIKAVMIVEIAGRPPEHVSESLKKHIEQLHSVKGLEVLSEKISEPKKIEQDTKYQDMYTCFAEVEVQADSFPILSSLIFDFMPSSIEVLEPAELAMSLTETTELLNMLSGRLHRYDEIAKMAQLQTQQIATQFQILRQKILEKNKAEESKDQEKKKEEKPEKKEPEKKPADEGKKKK